MKLLLLSVIVACILDGVMAVSMPSPDSMIYFVIGGVVLTLVGIAIFTWLRKRHRHHTNNIEDPPNNIYRAQPRSTPHQYRSSTTPINQGHASQPRDRLPNGRRPSPGSRHRPRPQNDGAGVNAVKLNEPSEKARQVAARIVAELQSDPTLSRQKIPYSSLYFVRVLSKGAFGEVWLAQLENRQVAIKRILNDRKYDEKEMICFASEIKLMALFRHPKIVEFIGVSWNQTQDLCAVTEYMSKGDLNSFLKRKNGQLNWSDHKIYLAEDVAEALVYLHALSPVVIHRDLKSKNILLDDTYRAKLSDFGISRERSVEETMTAGVGTMYWTAPEVLMGRKYTERADIFSFGVCLSEIDTHNVPYTDVRDDRGMKVSGMQIVKMVIRNKLRPTFAPNCPSVVQELAMQCLAAEPDDRPDAPELLQRILAIQRLL